MKTSKNLVAMVVLVVVSFLFSGCASTPYSMSRIELIEHTDENGKTIKEKRIVDVQENGHRYYNQGVVGGLGFYARVDGEVNSYNNRYDYRSNNYRSEYHGVESQYDKRPLADKCRSNPDAYNGFCGAVNRNFR